VQSTKRNAKYDEPSEEMERAVADLPTYKAGDAKSELIKAGGSALVKLLLKLVNWQDWRPCLQRGRSVISVLKLETHSQELQGSPWYQSAARCLQTCCASISSPSAQAAFRSKRSCTTTCSCYASSRGWQGQQNCLCVLSGRAQMIRSGGWASAELLEKVWMESYGGSCRDLLNPPHKSGTGTCQKLSLEVRE
jgi:hypothetical protein